jgi:hypothetical protein
MNARPAQQAAGPGRAVFQCSKCSRTFHLLRNNAQEAIGGGIGVNVYVKLKPPWNTGTFGTLEQRPRSIYPSRQRPAMPEGTGAARSRASARARSTPAASARPCQRAQEPPGAAPAPALDLPQPPAPGRARGHRSRQEPRQRPRLIYPSRQRPAVPEGTGAARSRASARARSTPAASARHEVPHTYPQMLKHA